MNNTGSRRAVILCIAAMTAMLLSSCTILHGREHLGVPIRTVVLTFDDGPNDNLGATAELLDVLAKHKVPAAFCVVGEQVTAHPDLVRRMAAEGHLIVNHTETHFTPFTKMPDAVMEEFRLCDAAIGDALGIADYRSKYFRPPVGLSNPNTFHAAAALRLKVVGWNIRGLDTKLTDPVRIVQRIERGSALGTVQRGVARRGRLTVSSHIVGRCTARCDAAWKCDSFVAIRVGSARCRAALEARKLRLNSL